MKNLYALVVGINAYEYVRPLSGCVGDATSFASYLGEPLVQTAFNTNVKCLTDNEATKDAIVGQFREHHGQAKKGDVALFFFAGHGHREQTPIPAFRAAELDGKIGNLVCVDSKAEGGLMENTCLADKELRYLIHELSDGEDPYILTIFDCCHSGDNTRDVADEDSAGTAREVARGAARARDWKGFIFHDKIDREALDGRLHEVIPEGRHIQMAACRDVEKAWEFSGEGAFTKALLETLRSHQGKIRYHDLYSRVKNRMRVEGKHEQSPQIYVQTANPADRYRLFLTHETDDSPVTAAVIYNEHEDEWRINLGALHGIPVDPTARDQMSVNIFQKAEGGTELEASVDTVFPGYAVLDLKGQTLDKGAVWQARLSGAAFRPLANFLEGDEEGTAWLRSKLADRVAKADIPFIEIIDEAREDADFVLHLSDKLITTQRPAQSKTILAPICYRDQLDRDLIEGKADLVYTDLVQMAKWTFLKDLEHQSGNQPVDFRVVQCVFEEGEETDVTRTAERGSVSVEFTHNRETGKRLGDSPDPSTAGAKIRIEVENTTGEELYCCVLYLSQEFGVQLPFFALPEFPIQPGSTVTSKEFGDQAYIPLRLPAYVIEDGWDGVHDYLKLVVSKTPFEAGTLVMDELPNPGDGEGNERSIIDNTPPGKPKLPKDYWFTQTVELYTKNPSVA